MNLRKPSQVFAGLTLALLLSQTASADSYRDYAQVTRVDPVYERVTRRIPETSCHIQSSHYRDSGGSNSHTGTIVGGILGAAIGNELGTSKRNKQVGAVAGGLLGASVGRDLSRGARHRNEEVCETRYRTQVERQQVGYRVTYQYQGRSYQTRTERHPGRRMPVTVQVRPGL